MTSTKKSPPTPKISSTVVMPICFNVEVYCGRLRPGKTSSKSERSLATEGRIFVNGDLLINKGISLVPCWGCGVVGGGVTPDDGGDMAEVDAEGVDVDGVLYRC